MLSRISLQLLAGALLACVAGCASITEKIAAYGEKLAFSRELSDDSLAFNLQPLRCEIHEVEGFVCRDQPAEPRAPEYPSPAQSFRPSADVRSVIGGRGEGLSCSIPALVANLLFAPPAPQTGYERVAPIGLHFRQSCVTHDYCYRHGLATYGYRQRDCDALLYDGAFRACSAIYREGSSQGKKPLTPATIAYCRREAALVLLGVTKFGGKAFRGIGQSTFYEFDPLARATRTYRIGAATHAPHAGFSVARLLPALNNSPASLSVFDIEASGWTLRDVSTARQVSVVQADASTVVSRGARRLAPPHFPPLKTTDKTDAIVVVQRDDSSNTGIDLYSFDRESGKFVAATGASVGTQFECNTPVNLLVHQKGGLAMIALGVAPDTPTSSGACRAPLRLGAINVPLHTIRLNGLGSGVGYRFTQHLPLFGSFSDEDGETLVLGRGYQVDESRSAPAVKQEPVDYRQQVTAFVLANDGKPTKHVSLDIYEDDEPVAAVRLKGADADSLISVRQNDNSEVCIKTWEVSDPPSTQKTPCLPVRSSATQVPLEASWLAMPPQVLRGDITEGELLIFFRVCANEKMQCDTSNEKQWRSIGGGMATPRRILLQTVAVRLKPSGSKLRGLTSAGTTTLTSSPVVSEPIDIPAYFANLVARDAEVGSLRAKEFVKQSAACRGQNISDQTAECEALLRQSALHWRQSQTIASIGPTGDAQVFFVPHPFGVEQQRTLTIAMPK